MTTFSNKSFRLALIGIDQTLIVYEEGLKEARWKFNSEMLEKDSSAATV